MTFSLSPYTNAILKAPEHLHFRYFETNTREIIHGDSLCFVAIKGNHFDGHDFVLDAFNKGVRNFVVEREQTVQSLPVNYIAVPNSIRFFQNCVAQYRKQFGIPVIGITGSNGKTIVKEWLCDILQAKYAITKSPKSYNSQIGVPLSVQELSPRTQIAVFEAGISQPDEMKYLEAIIQPTLTILTNIGAAHQENFTTYTQKLFEKLTLAQNSQALIYYADEFLLENVPKYPRLPKQVIAVGTHPSCTIKIHTHVGLTHSESAFSYQGSSFVFQIPFTDETSLKNAHLVIGTLLYLGFDPQLLQRELLDLQPISMRLEWITAHPSITLLNDTYSSDVVSIRQAVQTLIQSKGNGKKIAILTDLDYKSVEVGQVHQTVLEFLQTVPLHKVFLIGTQFYALQNQVKKDNFVFYPSLKDFEAHLPIEELYNSVVLLKGARKYNLEQLIPKITESAHPTYLKINLTTLAQNLRYFRALLNPKTKIMAMVKAFSYGGGTWEIAQELAYQHVDYLAVAYTDEAVFLRKKGIQTPILVVNAVPQDVIRCLDYDLEVQIHHFEQLKSFLSLLQNQNKVLSVHLKVDTGMHRLGFLPTIFQEVLSFIAQHKKYFNVKGIMTHLAAADNPEHDAYTEQQLALFLDVVKQCKFFYPDVLAHALNTAGILRFPQAQLDMVRLGIGMYGISPVLQSFGFEEIMSLHTKVIAVQRYEEIVSIGYNRSEYTKTKPSYIATLPVGYGDGISRRWSNGKGRVLIKGQFAPVIGRVCMDMMMIDVSHIPDVKVGDEVVLIGKQGSLQIRANDVAQWCDTIGYEIVTTINQRVKRIYVKE
ncbi:MAG: bifunctional UDP-N-acetylmuramoyl-tripeptide:D-alanyl-D-alanine ligase/alanine racemase [Bacteroidia bacterium]|nr:bifunctional UDP-N-acetylmuramoyl-tripeptide:D-alanyl-D-alanine ligase/alanine racemase [Bacteroidia bacterium]